MDLSEILEWNYNWLMDYQKRKNEFWVSDWGCGMVRYRSSNYPSKGLILVDKEARRAYPIVFPDGQVSSLFKLENVAPEWRDRIPMRDGFMQVLYRLEVDRFEDGVAEVSWMLQPDGSYFVDEGGYGRRDDQEEIYLYALIDKQCHVLVPFHEKENE